MAETLIPRCALANPSGLSKSGARIGRNLASASAKFSISARFEKFGFRARSTRSSRPDVLSSAAAAAASASAAVDNEESMSIDVLRRFFDLNIGKWNGSFYVIDDSSSIYLADEEKNDEEMSIFCYVYAKFYDDVCSNSMQNGDMLQNIRTKLSASSYGEDDLTSLIQTLYIKQPPSSTVIAGYNPEPEWVEYKIKETNLLTVDKYQQIGFFPTEKAFSLRYQTAGMLETVLRAGVLGEDDVGEESPRNLKVPSRRPSVVCENCLFSLTNDMRARAFHIMDPNGVLSMLLIFLEQRADAAPYISSCELQDAPKRITPFLGQWKGHSITKRSGVYGATIAEAETVASLEMDDKGHLIQDITSTSSGSGSTARVHWTGTVSDNIMKFDGGFQVTLLPGGMYMGCPCDIASSVAQSQSFHLEFCWMESWDTRQRLVRTYDMNGLAVSSTYFLETKL